MRVTEQSGGLDLPKLDRIAIVCFEDPLHVTGGVQRRIAAEVAYFSELGVDVTVISEGSREARVMGNVHYLTVATPPVLYPLRTMIFSRKAARLLQSLPRFDLVETHHDAGAAGLLAAKWMQKCGTTWVEVVHGVFADEFACVKKYSGLISRGALAASGLLPLAMVEQAAARRADAVVVVSEYAAEQVAARYGVPRHKIHVLPNGIETSIYSPICPSSIQEEKSEIIYVGRWHDRKGVTQLLRAFNMAALDAPHLRLTFIGDGPLGQSLRREAQELGISSRVTFRSNLTDSEIVNAYRQASFVCVPSLQEGQGIVALEAQACGAAIVATRAGGLAEAVVDGKTGILVEPGQVTALAEALVAMSASEKMRLCYGAQAARWAAGFAWSNMLSRVDAVYRRYQWEGALAGLLSR